MSLDYDAIIIGAGAAGLMCAITAASNGKKVVVLEHNERVGKKILISGGGKCNFTNYFCSKDNYISENIHFFKSALSQYTQYDFIEMVESYGVKYYEKKLGQLFCKNSAQEIINLLLTKCHEENVDILLKCKILKIDKLADCFRVETNLKTLKARAIVIATGGLSVPSIGATDFGYQVARQFGHKIVETRPGLVPIVLNTSDYSWAGELAGISIDCIVSVGSKSFRENLLFTHKGLSGPAILQISNYSCGEFYIDFLPEIDLEKVVRLEKNNSPKRKLKNLLNIYLPDRFVELWLAYLKIEDKNLASISNSEINLLINNFKKYHLKYAKTEGYRKAEVTIGGVDTNQISSKTMESNLVKGLYFIGEVLDVTGQLGGYNFQWAWSSGYVCGKSI